MRYTTNAITKVFVGAVFGLVFGGFFNNSAIASEFCDGAPFQSDLIHCYDFTENTTTTDQIGGLNWSNNGVIFTQQYASSTGANITVATSVISFSDKTIAGMFRPDATQPTGAGALYQDGVQDFYVFRILHNGTNLQVNRNNEFITSGFTLSSLANSSNTFLISVKFGSSINLRVNGSSTATSTSANIPAGIITGSMIACQGPNCVDNFFNTKFWNFLFYNRLMNESEKQTIENHISSFTPAPQPTGTIAMAWPVNSTNTPDFTFWVLSGSNLPITDFSTIGVLFGRNSIGAQGQNAEFSNFKRYTGQFDRQPLTQVGKSIKLLGNATTTWFAIPFWNSELTTIFGDVISFNVGNINPTPYNFQVVFNPNSAQGLGGTYGSNIYPDNYLFGQEAQFNTTSTAPFECPQSNSFFSSSTIAQIGCQIKLTTREILEWLFIPTTGVNWLNATYNQTKTKFPFNVVSAVLEGAQTAISTSSQPRNLSLSLPVFSGSIPVLNSSTLSNFIGVENKNLIFDVQSALFYGAAGLIALSIIF